MKGKRESVKSPAKPFLHNFMGGVGIVGKGMLLNLLYGRTLNLLVCRLVKVQRIRQRELQAKEGKQKVT